MKKWFFLCFLAVVLFPHRVVAAQFGDFYELAIVNQTHFPGWNEGTIADEHVYFKDCNLSGKDNMVLKVWQFMNSVPDWADYSVLKSAYYFVDGLGYYLPVDGDRTAIIPAEAQIIAFAVTSPSEVDAVTIGPFLSSESDKRIIESGINTRIVTGKADRYGVVAAGTETQVAELAISHPDSNGLSQAYARIEYRVGITMIDESGNQDGHPRDYHDFSVSYVAVTPSGEVALTPFTPRSPFGLENWVDYMFLPPSTSEIRMRVEIRNVENEPDAPYIQKAVVSADFYDTEKSLDVCRFIRQDIMGMLENNHNYDFIFGDSPALWYDLDGDGVMEWYAHETRVGSSYRDLLIKFTPDMLGQTGLNLNFGKVTHWCNYGDGETIGGIDNNTVFSTTFRSADWVDKDTLAITDGKFTTIDYDNDGRTDFLVIPKNSSKLPSTVFSLTAGGTLVSTPIKVLTPEEYYNDYELPQQPGGVVTTTGLGSGLSFVGDSGNKTPAGTFSDSQFQMLDLNNDGYLDFVNADGTYLMNMGNGMFVGGNIGGRVIFRDLDGDGLNDKVTYDSSDQSIVVTFQRPAGENPVQRKLFSGLNCNRYIWCRDFDRDGDVDILVPFDGPDNKEQAYLVMFENKGDGTFKRHEHFIDGNVRFAECADIDADGNYEVLTFKLPESEGSKVSVLKLNGLNVNETSTEVGWVEWSYEKRTAPLYVADFNNSGKSRIVHLGGCYPVMNAAVNERPVAPAKPTVNYDSATGEVTIEWGNGTDRETATADLTYSLRIGTAPDKSDILWADATPDGLRRNLSEGNCGYSRLRKLNASSWPQGNIYVSVQAVDDSGLGSTFSEYAVFEKTTPVAAFTVSVGEYFAVDDEALLSMSSAPVAGNSYTWDVDGGVITAQTDMTCNVKWSSPGKKTVSLTATTADGATATVSQEVNVMHVRFEKGGLVYGRLTLDMDCDGRAELLFDNNSQYNNKSAAFYESDDNGEYTPIKRLYNTALDDYKFNSSIAVDVNKDGLPDVIAAGKTGLMTHLINEDDLSMEVMNMDTPYQALIADFDNDGNYDASARLRNNGDYLNFTQEEVPLIDIVGYYDYDSDGLIDVVTYDYKDHSAVVYKNYGDFVFKEIKRLASFTGMDFKIGDFDADGQADFARLDTGSLVILWGDGTETRVEPFSGHAFESITHIFDLDNNGTTDILCRMNPESTVAVYFNRDHSFDAEIVTEESFWSPWAILTRTDGTLSLSGFIIKGPRTNTPPTAPTGLEVTNNGTALIVEWQPSTDAESFAEGLKYNISVYCKDEGKERYLISPLNGGKDGVPVPSSAQLVNSTRYTLPLSVVPDGEYEVKVQAVDSRLATSAFSHPVTISVKSPAVAGLPAESMVGKLTDVRLKAGIAPESVDFGTDSEIVGIAGNIVTVVWYSEGVKTVKAPDYEGTILIHPALVAWVDFPDGIHRYDKVRLACDNTHNSLWEIYRKNSDITWGGSADETWTVIDIGNNAVVITPVDDNTTEFIFQNTTYYEKYLNGCVKLRHTVWADYGETVTEMLVPLYGTSKDEQIIRIVDIDETSGRHALNLSPGSRDNVTGFNIFRETSRSEEYELIASIPLSQDYYVDDESRPAVKASRYRVSYVLSYGESAMGVPHQPMHVTINQGLPGSWNLIWSPYEGVEVSTYRILRGLSPNSLECIDEVSGNLNSYTDFSAPEGDIYYAIEILSGAAVQTMSRASGTTLRSRSNTVCTTEASVEDVIIDDSTAPSRYYNLSGIYVGDSSDNLPEGVYIRESRGKVEKIVISR